ncbi:toxin-antitoxin system HicB family antitoxin [Streptomyces sp. NPDC051322]|uniref:toxin-antitoxin system HicB family antitoxin n=1 Tax=Streptomyces sp. NPDC051322 TaxID=3154645 RepID=UPI00344EBD4E
MAKTQLNVRVDEVTAEAARERALQRGMSVNRYIEELVRQDTGEVGHTFVEAAADFMKQYESVFAEEFADESAAAHESAAGHEFTASRRRREGGR